MTIHALCQTLLKRFPLEAEVAPHFETIDDRTAEELKAEARGIVLAERCRDDKDLGRAVELLAVTLAESTLSGAIAEMLAQRHRLTAAFARHCERGTCAGLLRHIDGLLEVEAGVEPPHLVRRACADGVYDADGLLHLANTFRAGGKRQQEAALSIATWLGRTASDRHELYEGYRTAFFTKDGQPRGNVLSAAFRRDRPDVARLYDREQARLGAVRDQIQALTLSRRTAALLRLGHAVIDAYEGLKRRSALLDFDDLVERTRVLLSTPGRKEWVLYKLDQRLDHVLVDEAQDTSPSQWGVVEQLTEEFVAGAGARGDAPRTLFIVGDEKQSIYSFQGADLANFRRVRARLLGHAEAAGLTFGAEALDVSFRTSRAVLEVVDRVLALPEMAGAVTDPAAEAVLHATSRKHHAGLVELWPLADHEDGGPEPTAWPLPDRPRVADEPERRVAGAIAAKLRGWFEAGEVLEATGQPLRPVDVLILVSRRGTIQEAIIRALKREGVPVAGADRLLLGEHIAVKDLVALGRAILLPEDDLTLACLLKSPLLGPGRGPPVRAGLGPRPLQPAGAAARALRVRRGALRRGLRDLRRVAARADFMPPFEFYCSVLSRPDRHGRTGRHRLLERLGPTRRSRSRPS
jgi:ATP-dependent helicase/nuclease subunit A